MAHWSADYIIHAGFEFSFRCAITIYKNQVKHAMFYQRECIREYKDEQREVKYMLRLIDMPDQFKWDICILERTYEIKSEGSEKNSKFFSEWKITENDIPADAEIVLSRMKEEVFDILQQKFSGELRSLRKDDKF